MIKEKVAKVLNDQINAEFYSAYLYLAMSAWADIQGFKGFANWLRIQAKEEMAHGTHIYDFLLDRDYQPSFDAVKKPEGKWKTLVEVYEQVLKHEQHVTDLINNIATVSLKEADHASYNFIMWYVNEQVEEEATANEILTKLRLIGDNVSQIYTLDTEFAGRTFTDPFAGTSSDT
ncbi:MAG: ferritin [Fusobacteriaceae bacterium]|jgi:ferritin|nr:ferritin [Fusobacteriaceae bacterium]